MTRRILVARAADASNLNAQSKNAQQILRYWRSQDYRPSILGFGAPDVGVASNRNVDIVHLSDNRLWRAALFATYMRNFDAIFYPGLHHRADWLALKTRQAIGYRRPVIATMEGVLGNADDPDVERRYIEAAGHRIYCGNLCAAEFRRYDELCCVATHIIAISPFLARLARARYGDKVSVLPLGIDAALFRRESFERRTRPRVVAIGNTRSGKRPEVFLSLASKFPQADFVWFGDSAERESLVCAAASRGLNNIYFPGAVPPKRLASELAVSDILVHPSICEGVPKVTQEAAASGLAQIVFGFYETPTVVDGINGFVVWSDEELLDRLAQLLADADLTEAMGRAGQHMAKAWSWEIIAPKWETRIVEVCSRDKNS